MQELIDSLFWLSHFEGLIAIILIAITTWLLSMYLKDVSIVDSAWSIMIFASSVVYLFKTNDFSTKNILTVSLVTIWALRLSIYLTWRNWDQPEDHRYAVIRKKYSPYFPLKSLIIIFIFQAILAWLISLPIADIITHSFKPSAISYLLIAIGVGVWLFGLFFESISDYQLARFKTNSSNHGKVLDHGLWKYSRHPNYFGECLIWWGFYLIALSVGAWWSIISPIIMTWLLLKFSGVVMLEKTITERRPQYKEYILRTNAFIPGPVKKSVRS